MSDQSVKSTSVVEKNNGDVRFVINPKPVVHTNVAAKAKAVLGRIRALEIRAQSLADHLENPIVQ